MSKKAITIVSIVVVVIVIVIGIGISIAKAHVTEVSVVQVPANSVQVSGNVYEVVLDQVARGFVGCPVETMVTLVDLNTERLTVMPVEGVTVDVFSVQGTNA